MAKTAQASGDPKTHPVPIFIDGKHYQAPKETMTGSQIRALAKPPIGADRDLWIEGPKGLDKLVGDDQVLELEPATRFFTVPKVINPGAR